MAQYEVHLKPRVEKQLSRLPRGSQRRIATAITVLASDPRPRESKKLSAEENIYRIRVGDYRILYEVHDQRLVVLVVAVGNRKDVYRKR